MRRHSAWISCGRKGPKSAWRETSSGVDISWRSCRSAATTALHWAGCSLEPMALAEAVTALSAFLASARNSAYLASSLSRRFTRFIKSLPSSAAAAGGPGALVASSAVLFLPVAAALCPLDIADEGVGPEGRTAVAAPLPLPFVTPAALPALIAGANI